MLLGEDSVIKFMLDTNKIEVTKNNKFYLKFSAEIEKQKRSTRDSLTRFRRDV